MQEETVVITPESAIERLVPLFTEINTLNEDVKAVTAEIKEANLDASVIVATAKLIANEKYASYREKAEAILELLQTVGH